MNLVGTWKTFAAAPSLLVIYHHHYHFFGRDILSETWPNHERDKWTLRGQGGFHWLSFTFSFIF